MGMNGAIGTAHPLATATGLHVLQQGGNFMDAALAAAAVLNVTEPYNSNLGGDVFMIVHDAKSGQPIALNGSGIAPKRVTLDTFRDGIPTDGLAAASIPGQVHGWIRAHERWCTWDLADIFAPAIRYAEEGFPANLHLSQAIHGIQQHIERFPSSQRIFTPAPRPGDTWANPDMGQTLRLIVQGGIDVFYRGEIAERIADFCAANNGYITVDDLASHETQIGPPLSTDYRGHTIYEQPLVSQGHILLEELNITEGYDIGGWEPLSADVIHVGVEAKKLAFADKLKYSGDPAFSDIPLTAMLSKQYADQRREQVDLSTASSDPDAGPLEEHDTTYFCIADKDGNAVSFIQSIFHGFGCGVVIDGTGMLLNNRMACFNTESGHPNCVEPGKRPLHTLNTYMIYRDGKPWVVAGSPGGDVQVQTNLQVIQKLIDYGWTPQEAVEAPRWHHDQATSISVESRFPPETIAELERRGHSVTQTGLLGGSGNAQVIMINPDNGAYIVGSDPRGDGFAAAF
jgi:gamma-glutamyltranspeptidase / glutathione hydrolase